MFSTITNCQLVQGPEKDPRPPPPVSSPPSLLAGFDRSRLFQLLPTSDSKEGTALEQIGISRDLPQWTEDVPLIQKPVSKSCEAEILVFHVG